MVVHVGGRRIAESAARGISRKRGEPLCGVCKWLRLREIHLDEPVDFSLQSGESVRTEPSPVRREKGVEVAGADDLPGQPARCDGIEHGRLQTVRIGAASRTISRDASPTRTS